MFVGGLLGFLLDNTIPGTPEERLPTESQKKTPALYQRPRGVGSPAPGGGWVGAESYEVLRSPHRDALAHQADLGSLCALSPHVLTGEIKVQDEF